MEEDKSLAMTLFEEIKEQNKRLYKIIFALIIIMIAIVYGFIAYLNQFDYGSVEEYTNTTDNGGNACIGDNCNNGDSVQEN